MLIVVSNCIPLNCPRSLRPHTQACKLKTGQDTICRYIISQLFLFPYLCRLGTLVNDQLDAQFFYFIIRLLQSFYVFRATSRSSSGGQIVLIQHLVSSLSVSCRPVLCTGRQLTESDDTRCCINTICPPDDDRDVARNT